MSASTSCREVLEALRRGEYPSHSAIWELGQNEPDAFFRIIVESLADSFDPAQAAAYEYLMRAWIPEETRLQPVVPDQVNTVNVLSRVTLGADIKITSTILNAMKRRFPEAAVVLVGNRKSAELFAADSRITHLEASYPRSGSVSARLEMAYRLRRELEGPCRIVLDPDSRITQLGRIPVCEPQHYFHFPSRTAQFAPNLTALTQAWLQETFGVSGQAYMAPEPVQMEGDTPRVTVSLGVGENETKRIPGDFEWRLIHTLGEKFRTIWIDRGVGGGEAQRVTAAAEASGCIDHVRFWEGSFAGFSSLIAQSDLYVGYDSAGQHAAAASRTPLISIFAGAPSGTFRARWSPQGVGPIEVIDTSSLNQEAVLERVARIIDQSINP